jgi:mannose-6-phosphate isomerase-like protein (cupin superfamily)
MRESNRTQILSSYYHAISGLKNQSSALWPRKKRRRARLKRNSGSPTLVPFPGTPPTLALPVESSPCPFLSLKKVAGKATGLEDLFDGWRESWRNGINDYVHYHSRIHEVLGIARGKGSARFGGNNEKTVQLKAGDVAVLPAGNGHQCLAASADFLVVGADLPFGHLR